MTGTLSPEKAMSRSDMINGLTPHLFAAGMAAIVVAFPTPNELFEALKTNSAQVEIVETFSSRSEALSMSAAYQFSDFGTSVEKELRLCQSIMERGKSDYAEECRLSIARAKKMLDFRPQPANYPEAHQLIATTELLYCRLAWQESVQNSTIQYTTESCLENLPKLATKGF